MTITVMCNCGKRYQVKDALRGKTVVCRSCQNRILVPAADAGVSDAETPPTRRDPVTTTNTRNNLIREEFQSHNQLVRSVLEFLTGLFISWPKEIVDQALAPLDAEFARPDRSRVRMFWIIPAAYFRLLKAKRAFFSDPLLIFERTGALSGEFWRMSFDDDAVMFRRADGETFIRIPRDERERSMKFASTTSQWNLLVNGERKFNLRKKALRSLQEWAGLEPSQSAIASFANFAIAFVVCALGGLAASNVANSAFSLGWSTEQTLQYGAIAAGVLLGLLSSNKRER